MIAQAGNRDASIRRQRPAECLRRDGNASTSLAPDNRTSTSATASRPCFPTSHHPFRSLMILQPAGRREACQGQSQGQPSIAVRLILVSQDQRHKAGPRHVLDRSVGRGPPRQLSYAIGSEPWTSCGHGRLSLSGGALCSCGLPPDSGHEDLDGQVVRPSCLELAAPGICFARA
jgi:hypothetical protein